MVRCQAWRIAQPLCPRPVESAGYFGHIRKTDTERLQLPSPPASKRDRDGHDARRSPDQSRQPPSSHKFLHPITFLGNHRMPSELGRRGSRLVSKNERS
jgi:hypothetical protein